VHIQTEVAFSAGEPLTVTVGEPGAHGVVVGVHKPGVSTPSAAAVCAAVIGLARLMHTPNGLMFRNGTLSLIVATGLFSALTMLVGGTVSELGVAPIEHTNIAPIATGWPMHTIVAELATLKPIGLRGCG
jgi:hypothetical protein